ncbi:hypothetical protein DF160_04815 [Burkholderia anthina]|nr:hypothetical protein DF160_04815 [Burkholderia anthina]
MPVRGPLGARARQANGVDSRLPVRRAPCGTGSAEGAPKPARRIDRSAVRQRDAGANFGRIRA